MQNNLIQQFTNSLFGNVRVVIDNKGEPWFVGSDVAKCLGYNDTDQALRDHVYEENKYLAKPVDLTGLKIGPRGAYIINEAGLYQLIFTSKLPIAREFTKWVTSEVLPTMRKIGFDNSMQLLQQENARLLNQVNYLNHEVGEWGGQHQKDVTEFKYFIHYLISNPNISLPDKIRAWSYDPDPEGVLGVDMDKDIENFVNTYIRGNNNVL